jgi:hypothetical protein
MAFKGTITDFAGEEYWHKKLQKANRSRVHVRRDSYLNHAGIGFISQAKKNSLNNDMKMCFKKFKSRQ